MTGSESESRQHDSHTMPVKKSNYFSRHWHGESSLVFAWWVNYVLLGVIVGLAVAGILLAIPDLPWLGLGVYLVFFLFYGWQVVGVWRSSRNYVVRARASTPRKSTAWARVAQTLVVLGILGTVSSYFPIIADMIAITRSSNEDIAQYYLQQTTETDLTLNGYINNRSVSDIKAAFEADRKLQAIVFNSPGGLITAAFELADFVVENNIVVGARGECVSACVFLLAAANHSVATPNSSLVFHHPEAMVDLRSAAGRQQLSAEIDSYYQRLQSYGVPADRFAEFRANGYTPLSLGEAFELSIVDEIWDDVSGEFHDPAVICRQVDCNASPVEIGDYRAVPTFLDMAYLTTGICFDDPAGGYADSISGVNSVACNSPHDNEVYASIEVEMDAYPGDQVLDELANTECLARFEGFVGRDYDSSSLSMFPLYPTGDSWQNGDRMVNCVLYDLDLGKLTGSAAGAGI